MGKRRKRQEREKSESVSFSPDLYMPIMWLQRQQVEKLGEGSMDQWMHHAGKNALIPIFSEDVFCSEGRLEAGKEEMEIPGQLKWLEISKIAYVI